MTKVTFISGLRKSTIEGRSVSYVQISAKDEAEAMPMVQYMR